jgi:hypothetical protein
MVSDYEVSSIAKVSRISVCQLALSRYHPDDMQADPRDVVVNQMRARVHRMSCITLAGHSGSSQTLHGSGDQL